MFHRDGNGEDLSSLKPVSEEEIVKEAPEDTQGESKEVQVQCTVSFVSLAITLFCKNMRFSYCHLRQIKTYQKVDVLNICVGTCCGDNSYSYVPVGDMDGEDEEAMDLETILRVEREREKTRQQEEMDEEVSVLKFNTSYIHALQGLRRA